MYFLVSLCRKYFVVLLGLRPDLLSLILFKCKLKSVQDQAVKSTIWSEISHLAVQALIAFSSANRGAGSTSHECYPAVEDIPIGLVHALSPIEAWLADTLIDVGFAEVAKEARCTGAGKAPDRIMAGRAVEAWLWRALIYFQLTVCTFKTKEN